MIYSRHKTAEAADKAAARYRREDPYNSYYVVNAAKGIYLYAVIQAEFSII